MAISSSSSWRQRRSWKLVILSLIGLTLLLVIPLHQLGDHQSPGFYTRLTKFLNHESTSYDPADGFIADFKESDTTNPVPEAGPADGSESSDQTPEPVDVAREPAGDNNGKTKDEPQAKADAGKSEAGGTRAVGADEKLVADEDESTTDEVKKEKPSSKLVQEVKPVDKTKSADEVKPAAQRTRSTDQTKSSDYVNVRLSVNATSANAGKLTDGAKSRVGHDANGQKNDLRNDQVQEQDAGQDGKDGQDAQDSQDDGREQDDDEHEQDDDGHGQDDDDGQNTHDDGNKAPSGLSSAIGGACAGFPDTKGIMLVMKTGATEAFDKLPTHLLTDLQCMDDFLLFSDLDQRIGPYQIYDVLQNVQDGIKSDRQEFVLYKSQVDCPVSQKDCTGNMKGGWDLDKYKFLHMVERAWEMRPNMEWYVFAEADTYIFWPNLVDWLRNRADPSKTPYVGSAAMLKGMPFAHGGSGYVIHGETVKKMIEIPDLAHKYDEMATRECCGDYLMSLAVNETGFKVKNAHPMFNGEKPTTLPYGDGHWCEPLLTMHHMSAEEVSAVWQYEKTREKKGTLLINEMYHAFLKPKLSERRDEWDNLADDVCYIGPEPESQGQATDYQKKRQKKEDDKNIIERRAHFSEAHCAKVCQSEGLGINEDDYINMGSEEERSALIQSKYQDRSEDGQFHSARRCFQWRYHKDVCCIARSFKLGKPRREEKPEEKWTSGWFIQGINDWIEAKGECQPRWKNL